MAARITTACDEPVTIRFRYTARDLEQAQHLMRQLRPSEAWLYRMIGPAFGIAAALGLLLYLNGHRLVGIICGIGLAALTYLAVAMPKFQANAAFKRFPYLQQEITADFGESGIELTTSAGRAMLPWEAFSAVRENDEVLMLGRSDRHVQIFPKRAFSAEELAEVRALLQRNLAITSQPTR